ncbi:MAG: hypothetical protein GXO19_01790 [Epsilonproteobacteria bacterium]|nr:hypothetical protein [Campylobacterota bacterium]
MREFLLKIALIVLVGLTLHDYFVKQCDILHGSGKCEIAIQHIDHKVYHQDFLPESPLPRSFPSHFQGESSPPSTLSDQIDSEVLTPPPKL